MTGTVITQNLVITPGVDGINANNPIIGYRNQVTAGNVTATSSNADFPVSNVANPSTALLWKSTPLPVADQYLTVILDSPDDVDYLAVAAHNFGSGLMTVSVEGQAQAVDSFTKLLLHMDGADASTTFTDDAPVPHTFTASGNAQLDTADRKFGAASGLFDGTGDYVDTPDNADFNLGAQDWTVEAWVKPATNGTTLRICGQTDASATAAGSSFFMEKTSGNQLQLIVYDGTSSVVLLGTTQFSSTINPGWHHVAAVRSGNTLMLFVDGVLEDSDVFTGTVPNSAGNLAIGSRGGGNASNLWNGWIDEFRLSVGIARWTSDFAVPAAPHPWFELVSERLLTTDGPIIFRWTPQSLFAVRLRIQPSAAAEPLTPQLAVLYVGLLLTLQRRVYVGHTPMPYGRSLQVANLLSISGAFLGRIVLGQTRKSSVNLQNITAAWYRAYMDPFLVAAQEIPFFFAWRPGIYPEEAGFAWLTGDPDASNQRTNGMMSVSFRMEGVA